MDMTPQIGLVCLLLLGANGPVVRVQADTNTLPHFQEVFRLLRANLPDVGEEDLNRAAVRGLLREFYPRVILETNGPSAGGAEGPLLAKTTIYDQSYGYVRVVRVAPGLGDQIHSACEALQATNRLKGLVIDLRFAGGQDYAAAAGTADRFLNRDQSLLEWDGGSARSTVKADALRFPLTALVNQGTSGAAEALAAILRETDAAVLVGSRTAGQAQVFKEFELSTGQRLRIATGQVRIGQGKVLSGSGVTPDIEVAVSEEDEKAYFADAFKILPHPLRPRGTNTVAQAGATNAPARRRVTEADLVRLQREGPTPEEQAAALSKADDELPELLVRDPALARALDLLKGIAIVERSR
jgi:hypothetical protein